jgi:formate hydrogenlyase subunit 4
MMLLSRLLATIVDGAAMLVLAVLLAMVSRTCAAFRGGVSPPRWRQTWDDLVKLSRKRRLRPGFASPLYPAWPVIALSATMALALIVPGFAFGLITAPLATVPLLAGLLALSLGARQAALLESGEGLRGLLASRAARRLVTGSSIWLVVLGALAVRAGSDDLGAIGGLLAASPGNEALVLLAGLALTLTLRCFDSADPTDYAGPELALWRLDTMVRRVVLLSVLLDLLAPVPMADAVVIASWPIGLLAWIVKMTVVGGVLIWLSPRRAATGLGVTAAIGVVVVLLIQTVPMPPLLIGAGLIVSLAGLTGLVRRCPVMDAASAVQGGIALIGFGLGAADGALLILVTLGLARLAGDIFVALSLIALLALPPFGAFAGDVAVLRAGFDHTPWLGYAMLAIVVLTAAIALSRLRPARFVLPPARRAMPAGLLLSAALALGVMPWLIAVPL